MELDDSHVTEYIFFKFKMAVAAILKIVFNHDPAADCLISVKFCVGNERFTESRQWYWYARST